MPGAIVTRDVATGVYTIGEPAIGGVGSLKRVMDAHAAQRGAR